MRVGIDLTSWPNRRGYGRFVRGLVPALISRGAHEYVLVLDAQTAARDDLPESVDRRVAATRHGAAEAASASGRRSVRDLLAMRAVVSRQPLDVLFFPSVYTYFPAPKAGRVILGVHDVIAEDHPDQVFPGARGRFFWRLKGRLAHRRADWVLTVSAHARRGVLRHFDHAPERVRVVDEAPDPVFRPLGEGEIDRGLLERWGLAAGAPFVLYVGGVNPHKNLPALAAALAAARGRRGCAGLRLVIVGDVASDPFTPGLAQLQAAVAHHRLEEAVTFTGYLPDAELVHLLNAARALVLPSLAEGFGLPAVEAAACGTPVVATLESPLPELVAGGGFFLPPDAGEDPAVRERWVEALVAVAMDPAVREDLGRTARARVAGLGWERSARQMEELLSDVEAAGG